MARKSHQEILDEISKFFQEKNFVFWRVERLNSNTTKNFIFSEVRNRQPECTWLLDLEKSENEILSEMHSKTRYNINLAIKKGVVCKQEKNLETYWKLNEMTTERNSIRTHDKTYIEKLLKLDSVYQLTTYFGEDVLSSAIVFKYENKMYYLFGASSNSHRNLMGPYLNQFEIIKLAKQGKSKSEIGMILRDTYGIPSVRFITKKRIAKILKANGLIPKLPEDITALVKKDIKLVKHLDSNKKDMTVWRGLIITESKINKLAKYYKRNNMLPKDWAYNREQAKLLVA